MLSHADALVRPTSSSTLTSVRLTSIRSGGKTARYNVRAARAITLAAGPRTSIDLAANATGVTVASAPSTTSPRLCSTRPSGHCRTGFSRRFCSVSPARHGALPEKWASISGRAIAGAGGYAMPPCPTRCIANWKGLWKPMTSTTLLGSTEQLSNAVSEVLPRLALGRLQLASANEVIEGHGRDLDNPCNGCLGDLFLDGVPR
jgi:hypothetical protein